MADHQIAAGDGGVVEPAHQGVLGGLVEIDHHVPAEDHVKFQAELDGVHEVEGLEDDVVADLRGYHELAGALHRGEVALAPVGGHGVGQLVDPLLRAGQCLLGDVGGQDAGVPLAGLGPQKFLDIDGEVVGLLPAGAAGAPDGHDLVPLVAAHQLRQDGLDEEVEVLRLPHEEGVVGGQAVEYRLHVGGVAVLQQGGDKGGVAGVSLLADEGGETAGHQLPLLCQGDAVFLVDELCQTLKIVV